MFFHTDVYNGLMNSEHHVKNAVCRLQCDASTFIVQNGRFCSLCLELYIANLSKKNRT